MDAGHVEHKMIKNGGLGALVFFLVFPFSSNCGKKKKNIYIFYCLALFVGLVCSFALSQVSYLVKMYSCHV